MLDFQSKLTHPFHSHSNWDGILQWVCSTWIPTSAQEWGMRSCLRSWSQRAYDQDETFLVKVDLCIMGADPVSPNPGWVAFVDEVALSFQWPEGLQPPLEVFDMASYFTSFFIHNLKFKKKKRYSIKFLYQ